MNALFFVVFAWFVAGSNPETVPDRCNNCHTVISNVQENFHNASGGYAFQNFLQVCGKTGKLSDACKNINATFFDEIYKHLETSLRPSDFCFLTGECSTNVVVPVIQAVRSIPTGQLDTPECELCKELVKHVVSNLTEDNFHELLLNACKQMHSFESDCTHITDEYYSLLHDYLLDKLNLKAVCSFVGICPGPGLFGGAIPITVPAPVLVPVPAPVPAPVPIPVPVTPRVNTLPLRPSYYGPVASPGFGLNFNFDQSPAYSLAPLAGAVGALAGAAGALAGAGALIPVLAIG